MIEGPGRAPTPSEIEQAQWRAHYKVHRLPGGAWRVTERATGQRAWLLPRAARPIGAPIPIWVIWALVGRKH